MDIYIELEKRETETERIALIAREHPDPKMQAELPRFLVKTTPLFKQTFCHYV